MKKLLIFTALLSMHFSNVQSQKSKIPKDFTYLHDIVPNIEYDIRYYGSHNFVGTPIDGYECATAILSLRAAQALAKVQQQLNARDLGLKIFDAYRPQRAVDHFIRWAKMTHDTVAKFEFYPTVDKKDLFNKGYIATRSGHSRGSTVDLTIIDLKTKKELDMGSPFDFFGEKSHHNSVHITNEQQKNRQLLKSVMEKHGFRSYSEEWWHYTLNNEPYKETYFDFPVQ